MGEELLTVTGTCERVNPRSRAFSTNLAVVVVTFRGCRSRM